MQPEGNEVDRWSIAQEASFPINHSIDQPRFQSNTPPNRWYIARSFQIWSGSVGYKEVARGFKPIGNGEIFWKDNKNSYRMMWRIFNNYSRSLWAIDLWRLRAKGLIILVSPELVGQKAIIKVRNTC